MAKTIDITIPDLGDFADVEVIEVLVGSGDAVEREDGLITLETDKASMDVPSPEDGVIDKITVSVGDKVSTGDVIGQMSTEAGGEAVAESASVDESAAETKAPEPAPPASAGPQTLVVPDLGDFDEVDVIEVHIAKGDRVEVEDSLITLETDKAAMDVPATVGGTVLEVLVRAGAGGTSC